MRLGGLTTVLLAVCLVGPDFLWATPGLLDQPVQIQGPPGAERQQRSRVDLNSPPSRPPGSSRNPRNRPAEQQERGTITRDRSDLPAFPEERVQAFLGKIENARERIRRSEELGLEEKLLAEMRTELRRVLPPGRYHFNRYCPLNLSPQHTNELYRGLEIECLRSGSNDALSIRIYRARFPAGERMFLESRQKVGYSGTLVLKSAELTGDWRLQWDWVPEEFLPANPFLEAIVRRSDFRTERDLTGVESLRSNIATLMRELVYWSENSTYRRERDLVRDWSRVVPAGTNLRFGPTCPLRVDGPPSDVSGLSLVQMRFQMSCVDHGLGDMVLAVPSENPAAADLARVEPSSHVQATVRFQGFQPSGDQFRILWDTIMNVEPDREFSSNQP